MKKNGIIYLLDLFAVGRNARKLRTPPFTSFPSALLRGSSTTTKNSGDRSVRKGAQDGKITGDRGRSPLRRGTQDDMIEGGRGRSSLRQDRCASRVQKRNPAYERMIALGLQAGRHGGLPLRRDGCASRVQKRNPALKELSLWACKRVGTEAQR